MPEPETPHAIPSTSQDIIPVPRLRSHATVDRVLGGGIVEGFTYLCTGRPGIGKSTLSLQIGKGVADTGKPTLIGATEETSSQIAERAQRTSTAHDLLYLFPTTSLEELLSEWERLNPALVIVDSAQYLSTSEVSSRAGSVMQMEAVGKALKEKAKETGAAVLILGHIIKNGEAAGPKKLQHFVDCTLTFDISSASAAALEEDEPVGDEIVRVFRTWKNRAGALASARFQMTAGGLVEVGRDEDSAS